MLGVLNLGGILLAVPKIGSLPFTLLLFLSTSVAGAAIDAVGWDGSERRAATVNKAAGVLIMLAGSAAVVSKSAAATAGSEEAEARRRGPRTSILAGGRGILRRGRDILRRGRDILRRGVARTGRDG